MRPSGAIVGLPRRHAEALLDQADVEVVYQRAVIKEVRPLAPQAVARKLSQAIAEAATFAVRCGGIQTHGGARSEQAGSLLYGDREVAGSGRGNAADARADRSGDATEHVGVEIAGQDGFGHEFKTAWYNSSR